MIRLSWLLLISAALPVAGIPAFPGAEGYGANATGGRGGDVYHVTNLNASGTGSFAEAIATVPGAGRTIVFDVSGYIRFPSGSSGTRMTASKVTIAGQTAPGDGVGFTNNFFRISGDDIVIRHLRFRHGKYGSGGDCIDLDSGSLNSILDHISMEFSTDENMSSYSSPPENLTLQYSLNSWGLESHSCGGLWDQNHATAHHNLWSHNHTRNPKARPGGLLEWINNVSFDWDIGFIMGDTYTPSTFKANVRSNYFICPPGNIKTYTLEKGWLNSNTTRLPTFSIYLDNNLMDRDGDGVLNGVSAGYERVQGSEFNASEVVPSYATTPEVPRYYKNTAPFAGSSVGVAIDTPLTAYKKIVSNAGALRLNASYTGGIRDEVDTILLKKLTTQTRFHVTRESDTGASASGFGVLASTAAPVDTDKDGMPDFYETALGWNPAAQDHNTALANSGGFLTGTTFMPAGTVAGYTRLEECLQFLAIPHGTLPKNVTGSPTNITVDLRKYTLGFSALPSFAVTNAANGTTQQYLADGTTLSATGPLVKFTPTPNYVGRARFEFTVTDVQGSAWTQTCALLVAASGLPRDLSWKGDGTANAWDGSSNNWVRGGVATAFSVGDRVTLDDSGSFSPVVNVIGSQSPAAVDVTAAGNYTFSGSGAISTTNALTKRGTGTLTINNAGTNNFSTVSVEEGWLSLGNFTAGGSGKMSLNGGSLYLAAGTANPLELNAPTTISVGAQQTMTGNWTGSQPVTLIGTSSYLWSLSGTWTGFTGPISCGTGNVKIRLNGGSSNTMFGSPAVAIDLGNGISQLMNRNGTTTTPIDLGSLAASGSGTQLQGTQTGAVASTYSIGALNTDATFAGIIANGGAGGITNINKVGTGTWSLTGNSTHTGTTNINAGAFIVNGSLGATACNVASGATLGGGGGFGGLVTANTGSTIRPGASSGVAGSLTTTAGLTLVGTSTLNFDLSGSTSSGNDKITVSGGPLTLTSATLNFVVNLLDGVLASGTYNLVDGTALMTVNSAPAMNLLGLPTGTRQTFGLQRQASGSSPAFINLNVSGTAPASLVWRGTVNGGLWDLNSTGNFTGGPTATFYNLDTVSFDDTSTVGSVILNSMLQPRSVVVSNNTRSYTWTGPGMITGTTSLSKTGSSSLTINPNMVTVSSTTVAASNQFTVADATGLAVGMAIDGGGFASGTTITAISGTALTASATTATAATGNIDFLTRNSFTGGTSIGTGSTILLGNKAGNRGGLGTGPVTFTGGTLIMAGTSGSNGIDTGEMPNALIVPTGQTGNLQSPQRGSLSGGLTGGGILNVLVKYVRGDFYGDWSAFAGQLNITAAQTGSEFRMAESYSPEGFPNASLSLGANVTLKHTGILSAGAGTTLSIGELSGVAGSTLQGGTTSGRALTYIIGAKGTNATFSGTISEQTPGGTLTNITKTGAGNWTLAGISTWGGGTSVNQGALAVTGSVSSAGAVDVSSGASLLLTNGTIVSDAVSLAGGSNFTGYGTLTADLNCSGTLSGRGFTTGTPGTLSISGSAFFDGATIKMRCGSSSDRVAVTGDLSLAGTIQISLAPGTTFGRYPLFSYGGTLTLGTVTLTGIPSGTAAQLSMSVAGIVSVVIDDSDEDGLADSWEMPYFGNLASRPADDPDGDGQTNAVEFLAGTLPNNGASRFAASLSVSGVNQFTLRWPSVPGKVYAIETNTTLSAGWTSWVTVPAASSPAISTTYPVTPVGGRKFFRILISP